MGDGRRAGRSARPRTGTGTVSPVRSLTPARLGLLVLLALWLTFPLLQRAIEAQDAVPFRTAASLAGDRPDAIYPRRVTDVSWTLDPAFRQEACPGGGADTSCDPLPFLSPPIVLPLAWVADAAGPDLGVALLRLVGCLGAASGMWLLARRFDARADLAMVLTAVLLTPMVYVSSAVGQTSSLMLASVALGTASTDRTRRGAVAGAVWAATAAFKLFPIALVPIAAFGRRWRLVAWAAGLTVALAVLAAVLAPLSTWGEFVSASRSISATTVPSEFNLSLDALGHVLVGSWDGTSPLFVPLVLLRVVLLGGLFAWRMRDADLDVQWAWGWVAVLLVHPQVWWHYGIVVVGALAVGVALRPGRKATDAWWVVAGAAATVLLTGLTDQVPLLVVANGFAVAVLAFLTVAHGSAPARRAHDDVVDKAR
jgi:hypothetical protein